MRQLLCLKAHSQVFDVSKQLQRLADYYLSARGLRRELLAAAICLIVGVLVMPCLIFACGRLILGPYALLWLLRAARELLHNRTAPDA